MNLQGSYYNVGPTYYVVHTSSLCSKKQSKEKKKYIGSKMFNKLINGDLVLGGHCLHWTVCPMDTHQTTLIILNLLGAHTLTNLHYDDVLIKCLCIFFSVFYSII